MAYGGKVTKCHLNKWIMACAAFVFVFLDTNSSQRVIQKLYKALSD